MNSLRPVTSSRAIMDHLAPNGGVYQAGTLSGNPLATAAGLAALALLGAAGFDPVYGARPLKRAIQQQLENPLANKILSGAFTGGDLIRVTVDDGRLVFAKG